LTDIHELEKRIERLETEMRFIAGQERRGFAALVGNWSRMLEKSLENTTIDWPALAAVRSAMKEYAEW
jgi:hypothetical protein